jgi:uncharacterized membrane protein YccC
MSQVPADQLKWWEHIFILHALKVGLAGVLALFFAEALHLQFPQWSLFTVMVLMIVQYPGSIALKSLFRFVGTLIGASLGVWVVSDYASAPIPFLTLTFLVMGFASYKAGRLGRTMAPYGYLLAGLTLITIESSGLTQPETAWSVALSRTEEIFIGIIVVLIVTSLFGLRRPRLEFQELARSMVDQLTNLTNAKLQEIRERRSSNAALMEQETALLRKLLSLDSLLTADRRESLYFSANTGILHQIRDSLRRLVQAVFDLNQPSVDCDALNDRFRTQIETLQNLFQQSCSTGCRALIGDPSIFESAFQSLDSEFDRWLRTDDIKVLPADELAALLRCADTLVRIQNELLNLHNLEIRLQGDRQDTMPQPEPPINQRGIDRRLVIVGIKGGLVSVISLSLVVCLHLPGSSIIPTAAWTAVLVTSYEIAFGRPGHLRSFRNLLMTALIGFLIMLLTLVLAPFMSNYWFMNLILFCILFGYGYFASKTPGMTFWILGTLLLVSVLVALNAQNPVPFASDIYPGQDGRFTRNEALPR